MAYEKKGYRRKRSLNMDGSAADMVVHKVPGKNFKYHELAKEFVNNGCRQTLAYATVTGKTLRDSSRYASVLFRKPFMTDLIRAYMVGDHEAPMTKNWAIKTWTEMVNCNVLDYIDDDGDFLSIAELRKLPPYVQRSIKKIEVKTKEQFVKLNGKVVMDKDGTPMVHTEQRVVIELIDKQKALSDLARAEKWIETHMNINISAPVSADQLIEAQLKRQKSLMVSDPKVIEGEKV